MTELSKNRTYGPKEILALDGKVPVKLGKGRMSLAGITRIHELVGMGYTVKGYEAVKPAPSTGPAKSTAAPVVRKAPAPADKIETYVIFWPMEQFKAVDKTGKVWSMANACNNCMVSLVQCHCGDPHIYGDISVSIEAI